MYPHGFTELFPVIAQGRCQVTLVELAQRLELDAAEGMLGHIAKIGQILESHKLRCIPALTKGEINTVRAIRFESAEINDQEALALDLAGDECSELEFKSSLCFDIKKYENLPAPQNPDHCKSEDVVYSALKSIAAFANHEGGRIYIGITDEKEVVGLQWDLMLTALPNIDKWQLYFRDLIRDRFKDGPMINEYVELTCFNVKEVTVARIDVSKRAALTFIRKDKQHILFRRQGNRTATVDISEMEEFLASRWQLSGAY
jgi:hypothetical protein